MSKVLTRAERREMLDRLMAYLEKHILPEANEVEIEISQPLINDLRAEALDPLGMVHLKPGPDIYIEMHIALSRYNPHQKHRKPPLGETQ